MKIDFGIVIREIYSSYHHLILWIEAWVQVQALQHVFLWVVTTNRNSNRANIYYPPDTKKVNAVGKWRITQHWVRFRLYISSRQSWVPLLTFGSDLPVKVINLVFFFVGARAVNTKSQQISVLYAPFSILLRWRGCSYLTLTGRRFINYLTPEESIMKKHCLILLDFVFPLLFPSNRHEKHPPCRPLPETVNRQISYNSELWARVVLTLLKTFPAWKADTDRGIDDTFYPPSHSHRPWRSMQTRIMWLNICRAESKTNISAWNDQTLIQSTVCLIANVKCSPTCPTLDFRHHEMHHIGPQVHACLYPAFKRITLHHIHN